MITLGVIMFTFDEILDHFGGTHQALADRLTASGWEITREAVSMWGGEIPPGRAYQIEVISGGKFPADRLPIKGRSLQPQPEDERAH
jgi:hypothetical protein